MRNIVQYVSSELKTDLISNFAIRKVSFSGDTIVVCFEDEKYFSVHSWCPKKDWACLYNGPSDGGRCVALQYDPVFEKALLVFSNGNFVQCSENSSVLVGSLETDIFACEFDPTGEFACILLHDEIIFISTDFDASDDIVMGKHTLSVSDLNISNSQVSVGWGKKETQFQGRGARREQRMQDPTTINDDESREPMIGTENDTSISWRGDGQFVAVNSMFKGERAIRVFNSMWQLHSVSEPVTHLSSIVSWEPRGSLIAAVKPNNIEFFELNGLRRYSFPLQNIVDKVVQVQWSADSTVLSVLCESGDVHLYTIKNWHWYHKQTIKLGASSIRWHPEMPCTMSATAGSKINIFTFRQAFATDQGLSAVIDERKVLITPIDRCGIPPPMALTEFLFSDQPEAVAVKFPNIIAVSTIDDKVHILELNGVKLKHISEINTRARSLSFDSTGNLVIYTGDSIIHGLDQLNVSPATNVSVLKGDYYLKGSMLCSFDSTVVYEFNEPCTDFVASENGTFFGLSRSHKLLHSSGKVIDHGVTSILATENHLLYTTLTTLKFLHFNSTAVQSKADTEQVREIERGSLLVTAIPHKMAVVLQAPRGNLETIYPRIFVLGEVRKLILEKSDYKTAFEVCRTHRIDMNLLYDLDPFKFSDQVEKIVNALGSGIDLVMSALRDVDVTKSMYVDTANAEKGDELVEGKVNNVLSLLKPYLQLQNRITSLCLQQPPDYVEALECAAGSPDLIRHLLVLCDADTLYKTALSVYQPRLALVVAQQAQMDPKEYIPFLRARDSENEHRSKFNIDLFLRRFESAIIHLIDDLNSTDTEISEFAIRHNLHNLALNALSNQNRSPERSEAQNAILLSQAELWSQAGMHEKAGVNFELLDLKEKAIESYVLGGCWRKAMAMVDDSSLEALAYRLAEVTEFNKQYADCGTIHMVYLNNPHRAIELYCLGNNFDDAILVARRHKLESKLAEHLRETYASFQELLTDFSIQVPAQLKRLRQIREKRNNDILGFDQEQHISDTVEGLTLDDTLSVTGSETSSSVSVYTRYTDKTGASTGTAATNATRRTLKNHRRQERKKARGKKGSVYEEDYLISSTTRLITRLSETHKDLRALINALTRCKLVFYANKLTVEYLKIVNLLKENIDEIYHLDDEARVRFDGNGTEYIAEQPIKPSLPPPELI